MNKTAASFAVGVLLMVVANLLDDYALNARWEFAAFNHHAGYFTSTARNPNKLEFRWFR